MKIKEKIETTFRDILGFKSVSGVKALEEIVEEVSIKFLYFSEQYKEETIKEIKEKYKKKGVSLYGSEYCNELEKALSYSNKELYRIFKSKQILNEK